MGRNSTILHPQPCVKNNTKTPPKGIPKKENIKPVSTCKTLITSNAERISTKPPVMGQVKLLKRGEVLGDTLTKHHSEVSNGLVDSHEFNEVMVSCEKALPTKKKVESMSRKAEVTKAKKDVLSSTSRLGPNPKIVSKDLTECFAGFGFPSSPHPSSLPLPGFSVRNP
ncbi:hypothetical protein CTI12_AA362430 [Artemisia annua]|uniref:Uncharacterized protein n=1 Tax=Artemisia annua TaxID=35608 RepID=A0A2U1MN06_ARTAN|nr:hypothetical protein CTI12_AA362430 [Artemisia annua]